MTTVLTSAGLGDPFACSVGMGNQMSLPNTQLVLSTLRLPFAQGAIIGLGYN